MKTRQSSWRPTQLFHWLIFGSVEAVKISPPNISGFGRSLLKIGKRNHDFHLPEFIFVTGIIHCSFEFDGALHALGRVAPIALEVRRNASFIQSIRDDGVEHAAQGIPLKFEIAL